MNRFEPRTTNNFYPDLPIGEERYSITGDRSGELDFAQTGKNGAEESTTLQPEKVSWD
jgi:hypothetical protein